MLNLPLKILKRSFLGFLDPHCNEVTLITSKLCSIVQNTELDLLEKCFRITYKRYIGVKTPLKMIFGEGSGCSFKLNTQ